MSNPVTHFEIVGQDPAALQRFYEQAFGWQMKPAGPGYAMACRNSRCSPILKATWWGSHAPGVSAAYSPNRTATIDSTGARRAPEL